MISYVCDSCGVVIKDPYDVKMKEFHYTSEYEHGMSFPIKTKTTRKIHLCDKCFGALKDIAERKEESK